MIPSYRGLSIDENSKGQWQYGYLIEDNGEAFIINEVIEANEQYITIGSWNPVRSETVSQSTGLEDKNDKEIFEGDILKDGSEYGKVVYDPDRTMWRVYGKDFDDALSDWWTGRVVGNIYENPELLEADHD